MWFFGPRNPDWVYAGTVIDGEKFEIQGLDVWKHHWEEIEAETAIVKDPIYRQTFHFGVYRIRGDGKVVEFAAGEFSNMVWGFYLRRHDTA